MFAFCSLVNGYNLDFLTGVRLLYGHLQDAFKTGNKEDVLGLAKEYGIPQSLTDRILGSLSG